MEIPDVDNRERFSLLLLDPGEIYFEDFAVFYYPAGTGVGGFSDDEAIQKHVCRSIALRRAQKGRLKICSKSVVFDPKDISCPILKFPLKDCTKISKWMGPLLSKIDNQNLIEIESDQVVEMLVDNTIAPFTFIREKRKSLFAFNYAKVEDCLPQMLQLSRAATLPAADQAAMISAIVLSRQRMVKFDSCWIEDLHERIICETQGNRIAPLVTNPGRILLTTSRLYFQPYNNAEPWPVFKMRLGEIKRIIKRRFLLRHTGLEIYCSKSAPVSRLFLALKSQSERDTLYDSMMSQAAVKLEDTGQENMMILWQNGVISNYDYLLYLNSMADRSFNDLTQYPVFPWVITDYRRTEFDLEDPTFFRNMSKPVGALNEERLRKLKARYNEMPYPRFLYGSHYSTPGFVLYYLVRKVPLYMLCLHNGRFDHPDRMFNSIVDTWKNVTTNTADFKELTPEFYEPQDKGQFLVNSLNLDFGVRQDGTKVDHVELPKWANDPEDCVSKLRQALECDLVSADLHDWIDLMFGFKQRGTEAEKADNVFYYLTYEGAKDLDSVEDLNDRYSLEVQIMEFGQVPRQLFVTPHPHRFIGRRLAPDEHFLTAIDSCTSRQPLTSSSDDVQESTASNRHAKWFGLENLRSCFEQRVHKSSVSAICLSFDGNSLLSVSHDSMLKMFSVTEKRQLRSVNLSNMCLSSCAMMPNEKSVVVGSWDNCVYMYSTEYGRIVETTMAHDDAVSDIFWNDGLLATASWDSTAKIASNQIWSYSGHVGVKVQSCAQLLAELDHDTRVSCVCLTSDNSRLVTGTMDGHVYTWDVASYELIAKHEVHEGEVYAISISPDDQRIISCGSDLKVLDLKTGMKTFTKCIGDDFRCVCWNGQAAITGGNSGHLYVWDLVSAQLVEKLPAHDGPVTCITVSSDAHMVVTGGSDGRIVVWKTDDRP